MDIIPFTIIIKDGRYIEEGDKATSRSDFNVVKFFDQGIITSSYRLFTSFWVEPRGKFNVNFFIHFIDRSKLTLFDRPFKLQLNKELP